MKYDGMRITIKGVMGIYKLKFDSLKQYYHIQYEDTSISSITYNDKEIINRIDTKFFTLVDAPRLMLRERLRREKT